MTVTVGVLPSAARHGTNAGFGNSSNVIFSFESGAANAVPDAAMIIMANSEASRIMGTSLGWQREC